MENSLEQVLQFEGQEIKVITDKGVELFNLANSARVLGLTQTKSNGSLKIRWTRVKEKLNTIYSGIQNLTPQHIEELKQLLEDIEETDDRNSLYCSKYITSRLAMECHSDKANKYKDWLKKQKHIGEINKNNNGDNMKIIKYNNCNDILIEIIESGEKIKCSYSNFKSGKVKSHFTPSIYGVGIIGDSKNIHKNDSYKTWIGLLRRCYGEKGVYKTYKDVICCDEWKYYDNFKKWYDENYYDIEGERIELDKDILVKGNKIYSPNTCIFVPHIINSLFTKSNSTRGSLPIGVSIMNKYKYKKYCAYTYIYDFNDNKSKRKTLGYFLTPQEAFETYKNFKENNIKEIAEHYKNKIPKKLYEALYKYKVDITD